MLSGNRIHLLITDIRMPVMDGLALASRVQEQFPHILTVVLTGYADFEYAKEALRHGVFDYLLKPVNEDELQNVMNRARSFWKPMCFPRIPVPTVPLRKLWTMRSAIWKEHYREDIDFGKLSSDMGFTSAYLTKLFNRYVGETPLKYLTSLRIEEASRLLRETTYTIAEVGAQVGYPDQFHFSKTFRKLTGKNPSAYRKEGGT